MAESYFNEEQQAYLREKRMARREWETLKIQDFERLEAENVRLRAEVSALRGAIDDAIEDIRRGTLGMTVGDLRAALKEAMSPD